MNTLEMKQFTDLPYTRPDMEALKTAFKKAERQFEAAHSAAEQIALIDEVQKLKSHYQTMQTPLRKYGTVSTPETVFTIPKIRFLMNQTRFISK